MNRINLDINSTLGLLPAVAKRLETFSYLNPSSIHQGGQAARIAVENAREAIKGAIHATRDDILFFTSGATESNNTALFLPFWDYLECGIRLKDEKFNVVISAVEHPSILSSADRLKKMGVEVRMVPPRTNGNFIADDFVAHCDDRTKLVSCMYVNNETGQILPIKTITQAVKEKFPRLLVHTDAVQAFGKVHTSFLEFGVDLMSISAHKIGGLSGVGAFIAKAGTHIAPFIVGGPQETRRRAGTENTLGITSFGIAAELASHELVSRNEQMKRNAKRLRDTIASNVKDVQWNFQSLETVGNTLSLTVPGLMSSDLVVGLDLEGIYVSAGSACSSGKVDPSSTLIAMGISFREASETIRISVGFEGSEECFKQAGEKIAKCINRMRG